MLESPNVSLRLSNRPESLLVVHQALVAVAGILGLDALATNDLSTAVTEACKNVVYHAYEGEEGPLELELYTLAGTVEVVVRDHGIGIRPHVGERSQPHTGIGLPIIHVLTQRVTYSNLEGGGTEIRMQFTMANAVALEPRAGEGLESRALGARESASTIELALGPSVVARAVLREVAGGLAARACFSVERTADVARVADMFATNAGESISASHLGVDISVAPRSLELRIGPLRPGSAQRVLDLTIGSLGPIVERVLEDRLITSSDSGESLVLRLSERR